MATLALEMTAPTAAIVPVTVPALYVGDVHTDVVDTSLFELFSTVGPVASVRVCRDTLTGVSLGYGYVNYIDVQDATKAIEKLNHTILFGTPIRIMWSQRDSDLRKSGIGNVFVKNLCESIDTPKLNEMFLKFGTILSCKVVTQNGKSKGFGFVQFDCQDSANAAIENLNGSIVDGKPIFVGMFIKKSDRMLSNLELKYTNLYMKNLDQDITEELIELKFSEFGKIFNVMIAKDENGNSKGFGFVNFENPDCAKKALEEMNGLQLGTKTLYVARAQKRAERKEVLRRIFEIKRNEHIQKSIASNVYIKNIDDSVDDDILREYFSQCGTITSAKIMRCDNGISKGFGFVCFGSQEEANKAVKTLHGKMFHCKPLYVAIAQRKEERRARLKHHFSQQVVGAPAAAVIPASPYAPYYYGHSGVMPHIPPRQGFIYPSFGVRPSGWQPAGFIPPSSVTYPQFPQPVFPNNYRHHRPNRAQMNPYILPHSGRSAPLVPHLQQPNQSFKDANAHAKHAAQNGRQAMATGLNNGNPQPHQTEALSSMLAAAPPPVQKQMLGERIFPLVHKLKADLAAKITGMLLEMDNSELLLLLESPESLAAKVEEAVQVLKFSVKAGNAEGQEPLPSVNSLPAGVAVN